MNTHGCLRLQFSTDFRKAYRSAAAPLFVTQMQLAVQINGPSAPSKLEHVEGEAVGGSFSISLHLHHLVAGVGTTTEQEERVSESKIRLWFFLY